MKNYEITSKTLALIPVNKDKTKVIEKNKVLYYDINVMKIIDDSCNSFGSSYKGRYEGTKNLIGVSYKAPIIIEESNNIIYFPTTSPSHKNCCWISLKNIKNYKKNNNNISILFDNNYSLEINISLSSFNNQYLNAMRLESILNKNIKKI